MCTPATMVHQLTLRQLDLLPAMMAQLEGRSQWLQPHEGSTGTSANRRLCCSLMEIKHLRPQNTLHGRTLSTPGCGPHQQSQAPVPKVTVPWISDYQCTSKLQVCPWTVCMTLHCHNKQLTASATRSSQLAPYAAIYHRYYLVNDCQTGCSHLL